MNMVDSQEYLKAMYVPDLKATVFFPSAGQKQLLLRFAKLTVVEG